MCWCFLISSSPKSNPPGGGGAVEFRFEQPSVMATLNSQWIFTYLTVALRMERIWWTRAFWSSTHSSGRITGFPVKCSMGSVLISTATGCAGSVTRAGKGSMKSTLWVAFFSSAIQHNFNPFDVTSLCVCHVNVLCVCGCFSSSLWWHGGNVCFGLWISRYDWKQEKWHGRKSVVILMWFLVPFVFRSQMQYWSWLRRRGMEKPSTLDSSVVWSSPMVRHRLRLGYN